MADIKDGAEAVREIRAEISEEIPKYREMAELIASAIVFVSAAIMVTCLVVIARNIDQMGQHAS